VNGWLVPAGNVELTAEAIIRILQTPVDVLTKMGRAGCERVRRMHDARREAGILKDLFQRAIDVARS